MKKALWKAFLRAIPSRWRLPVQFYRCRITGYVEAEMFLIRRWKDSCGIAVDVGANQGTYSFEMARWFRKVEAFEPNSEVSMDLAAYNPSRVRLHSVALSSSAGQAKFHVPISSDGIALVGWGTLQPELLGSSLQFSESPKFMELPVMTRTLDSYAFDDVAFIKIDVEGHEEDVLRGGRQTIMRCRPVVLLEVRLVSRPAVQHFFSNLDYQMFFLRANALNELKESAVDFENTQENFFAIPVEKISAIKS